VDAPSDSGAERRDKVLDEVSTAIHGGEAAVNALLTREGRSLARIWWSKWL
jgi:hypothetical protein